MRARVSSVRLGCSPRERLPYAARRVVSARAGTRDRSVYRRCRDPRYRLHVEAPVAGRCIAVQSQAGSIQRPGGDDGTRTASVWTTPYRSRGNVQRGAARAARRALRRGAAGLVPAPRASRQDRHPAGRTRSQRLQAQTRGRRRRHHRQRRERLIDILANDLRGRVALRRDRRVARRGPDAEDAGSTRPDKSGTITARRTCGHGQRAYEASSSRICPRTSSRSAWSSTSFVRCTTGATLMEVINDPYVKNRLNPEKVDKMLQNPEIVEALEQEIAESFRVPERRARG